MARFGTIFAPELHGQLLWFGRLRWLVVAGLALASFIGPGLGIHAVWPSLFVAAGVVAAYNLFFQWSLHRRDPKLGNLRVIALCLMVMDLAMLMVTTHFTGGMQSPLLPFFAFHMAIGTIMIAGPAMYLLTGGVGLGALCLWLLETRGVLRFHSVTAVEMDPLTGGLNLLTLVAGLFGIVYLTNSVTSLLKRRSSELFETTQALHERTAELQRLLDQLEDLERRKSHFMRISAHQLRSPLGTIKTALSVLTQAYVDPSTAKGRRLLDGAVETTDRLLEVVNDLLDLGRMREGRERAAWTRRVYLNQLLADLFDSLATEAETREVELVPDFEGMAVLDWGVAPDLIDAFENLMFNAIKYSERGGQVTVRLRLRDGSAVVDVMDRGIGIPEDYLDRVFLEFVRAPNAKHHKIEGTGLGLSIVKEVVETHGGTVHAASRPGGGSAFTIQLPLEGRTPPTGVDSPQR
jgi:signal transduction histidine kinase